MLPEVSGFIDRFKMIIPGRISKNGLCRFSEQSFFSQNYKQLIMHSWNFSMEAKLFLKRIMLSSKSENKISRDWLIDELQNPFRPPITRPQHSIKSNDVGGISTKILEPDVSNKSSDSEESMGESKSRIMLIFIRSLNDHVRKYLHTNVSTFDESKTSILIMPLCLLGWPNDTKAENLEPDVSSDNTNNNELKTKSFSRNFCVTNQSLKHNVRKSLEPDVDLNDSLKSRFIELSISMCGCIFKNAYELEMHHIEKATAAWVGVKFNRNGLQYSESNWRNVPFLIESLEPDVT